MRAIFFKVSKKIWLNFLMLIICTVSQIVCAHPMDLAQLKITQVEDRWAIQLRIHELAAQKLVPGDAEPSWPQKTMILFERTLQRSTPQMNGLDCFYLRPEMTKSIDDNAYLNLQVVATCPQTMRGQFFLTWKFPFLEEMTEAFQLVITAQYDGKRTTLVIHRRNPQVELGENSRTFWGFVKIGMGHIGAQLEEWQSRTGRVQFPEGIDHILFVVALVLSGGTLWQLAKTATGFTVGHSLTLTLSTYKIIHFHSKWIEVGIAFSIAFVAGHAFFTRGKRSENWMMAMLFGIVHGLGFSAALQDLELSRFEILTALVGFNIGVEIGQVVFVILILLTLTAFQNISPRATNAFRRCLALIVCLIGTYWVYYRGFI